LLAGLGGAAAAAASVFGHATPAAATDDEIVRVGHGYTASTATRIRASGADAIHSISDTSTGFVGQSTSGNAIEGASTSGIGAWGHSTSGKGVEGESGSSIGVFGLNGATNLPAILGQSFGNSTGVQGVSGTNDAPPAPAKTGVHGFGDNGASSMGVRGESPTGRGGVFSGHVAQLRLVASTQATHPTSGALGDLFLDKVGRLWLCKGGTTWAKVA
jgi:hypothetical protein